MLRTLAPGPKSTRTPLRMRDSTWPSEMSEVIPGLGVVVLFNYADWGFCGIRVLRSIFEGDRVIGNGIY